MAIISSLKQQLDDAARSLVEFNDLQVRDPRGFRDMSGTFSSVLPHHYIAVSGGGLGRAVHRPTSGLGGYQTNYSENIRLSADGFKSAVPIISRDFSYLQGKFY